MGLWVDSSLKSGAFICISSHGKKTTYRKETKWKRKREREREMKERKGTCNRMGGPRRVDQTCQTPLG